MRIILIILAIVYLLSPYDILPDFLPGWGWLDDGAVFYMLWRYFIAPAIRKKQREKLYRQNGQHHQGTQNAQHNRQQDTHSSAAGGRAFTPRDPYQVLDIGRNASQTEIQQAFKRLAGKYHPDKVHHLGKEFKDLAEKRFKEIQEAYQALKSR